MQNFFLGISLLCVCVCDVFFPFQIVFPEGREAMVRTGSGVSVCVCGILFLDLGLDEEISEWVELFFLILYIYILFS